MQKLPLTLCLFLCLCATAGAQQMFTKFSGRDIGKPEQKGAYQFQDEPQKFILEASGYNVWFERDEFYFVAQEREGDFIFSASMKFIGKGTNPHRKAGLMIRESEADNAAYVDGVVHGDGLTALQYREKTGAHTREIASDTIEMPDFIQLERKADTFIFRVSTAGKPLQEAARVIIPLNKKVLAGMFLCSHQPGVTEKAEFWNVRIEKPAPAGTDGYKNPSPSRLETINIETGIRKVIYETDQHIEAPNWSRNGEYLIYNSQGKLYRFDLDGHQISVINTGSVTANNNDHGISFDGKTLAISSSGIDVTGKRHSLIYTVPIGGGTPKQITEKGPSYWHGWSPDGKWLCYCAERNGNYDVYKIPAAGGQEIRLTTAEGLDDGPEYSPDGQYIYFNSTRSGLMQIWRMKPDGTAQEQVTTDNYQNWFAHPSPDGRWLVMISYLPDEVPAGSHPPNQRVMLRLMPVKGGEIKTIAFLYGGQGTINVPSWSPDSRQVAFVSYTY